MNGANLSPKGAESCSPGQAAALPWVMGKTRICPEGAASQSHPKLAPFRTPFSDPFLFLHNFVRIFSIASTVACCSTHPCAKSKIVSDLAVSK